MKQCKECGNQMEYIMGGWGCRECKTYELDIDTPTLEKLTKILHPTDYVMCPLILQKKLIDRIKGDRQLMIEDKTK